MLSNLITCLRCLWLLGQMKHEWHVEIQINHHLTRCMYVCVRWHLYVARRPIKLNVVNIQPMKIQHFLSHKIYGLSLKNTKFLFRSICILSTENTCRKICKFSFTVEKLVRCLFFLLRQLLPTLLTFWFNNIKGDIVKFAD